ncbi:riboflavin biosynthesis protein VVA0006-like [Coccinella septempunctata]|uniref:riboflavin biosynthesis protein VVA0006-like n=1 Tax=Coccinella septempunctata TaxID=41139 RepID=UPI001D07B784|nr:riboflavin biosynthesis protein VVA0006-like [Coccinella septempunctata]
MDVRGFRGKHKFLSNFFKCEVEYEGVAYPTAEHAFQAAKTFDEVERKRILSSKNPVTAKRLGRKVTLRHDWEEVKVEIMTDILRRKFQNPHMKEQLLETGSGEIIEENKWHDKFWGKCICKRCGGVGKNNLGLVIQRIRSEISQNDE